MMESINGIIERQFKVSENKIIGIKIIESPSFQLSIQQIFCDVKEAERLIAEGLPQIEASSVMMVMTWPETTALTNFLFEYVKDYAAANSILQKKHETI